MPQDLVLRYANVHPYLEEPLEKFIKRIPELKSIQPAPNQQALPMIQEMLGRQSDSRQFHPQHRRSIRTRAHHRDQCTRADRKACAN